MYPSAAHPLYHLSFLLPLFTLHNSLSPISFTSIQPIALFCPAEVSSSLSLSLPSSSLYFILPSICPSPILRFSQSPLFSAIFLSCARSSSKVPAATPAALPPLLCAKLWVFFLMRHGKTGREEEWLKRERRPMNQRSHFHLATPNT